MLGKHNFKERLRKMEKQDKHDRFSIRKLTIGAASVLIGFAFMGLNISSVQASSNPLDQIKEKQEQSNKDNNNSDQSEQAKPQINLEQNKNSQLAGQNNNQTGNENQSTKNDKQPASDQASQKAKSDAAKAANDQAKAGASKAKGNDQAKSSVNESASAAGNKTNNKSTQASDASSTVKQAAQGQNNKADNAQGKTETARAGQKGSANKENNKSDAAEAKDKQDLKTADLLKGKNNLSTDKNSSNNKDITSSINKLKAELDQANALEKSDNFKSIDQAKQNQLEALVKQANEMMQNYQTQELGISLLELPEEQNKNKKNGAKADSGTQSFDVGKLKGLTGSLSGLLSSLAYVPGQATQNVNNEADFVSALKDKNVTTINLTGNINVDKDIFITTRDYSHDLVIDGQGHQLKFIGGKQIYFETFPGQGGFDPDTGKSKNYGLFNLTLKNTNFYIDRFSNNGVIDLDNSGHADVIKLNNVNINNQGNIYSSYNRGFIDFGDEVNLHYDFIGNINVSGKYVSFQTRQCDYNPLDTDPDMITIESGAKMKGNFGLSYDDGGHYSGSPISSLLRIKDNAQVLEDCDTNGGLIEYGFVNTLNCHQNSPAVTIGDHVIYKSNTGLTFSAQTPKVTVTAGNHTEFDLGSTPSSNNIFGEIGLSNTNGFIFNVGTDSIINLRYEPTFGRSATFNIADGGSFIAKYLNNFSNLDFHTTNPKQVNIVSDGKYYAFTNSKLNLQSSNDIDMFADRQDSTFPAGIGQQWKLRGPVNIVNNSTSGITVYPERILNNKSALSDIANKGDASFIYKIWGQDAFNKLNLNKGKFKQLSFGTDALQPSQAGRYDATANPVNVPEIDAGSGTDVLNAVDAENSIVLRDSSITTGSSSDPDYNVMFDPSKIVTGYKWVNGLITDASHNAFDPTVAGSTPVDTTTNGVITVDASGKATVNMAATATGIGGSNAVIAVTYADGSIDYVPVHIKSVGAVAKSTSAASPTAPTSANPNMVEGGTVPANTTDATTHQPTNVEAKNLIGNAEANFPTTADNDLATKLSGYKETYTFVDADGDAITNFGEGAALAGDTTHKTVNTHVMVTYWKQNGSTYQKVGHQIINTWIKLKKSQADVFKDYNASGNITAHVVNMGDATSYENGLISTSTQVTYKNTDNVDQTVALSTLNVKSIAWAVNGAPKLSQATTSTPETATATVKFNDGSKANFSFKVTVVGASAASSNQSVVSGSQPTADQAKAAISNANATSGAISGLPSGTTATVVGWVNASEDSTTHNYSSVSTPASYSTNWSSASGAANTATGYVEVKYGDNTYQIVPVTLNIQSKAANFDNLHAKGNITAHVVNTGDVADYQNGLISTSTKVSYTDASGAVTGTLSSLGVTGITWATSGSTSEAPDVSAATTTSETATATVTFSDNSTATINFNVTVVGATASSTNQSVVSGKQPSAAQAKAAINNANTTTGVVSLSGLPSGTTATVDGWVNATETGGKYNVATTSANYSTTWSSATGATNTITGYVRVHYSDGTDQIVPVTLNINSLASSVDPNKSDVKRFNVHANATSADIPSGDLTLKNGSGDTLTGWTFEGWTTRSGSEGSYTYTDVPATGTHDLASYLNDSGLTNGTKPVTLYAKVKMTADHSIYYVPKAFTLTVVGAVAKGSASTNHGHSLNASDELQNYSTLSSDFGSNITSVDWTDANGTPVDATTYWNDNTDNDHATNPNTNLRINGSEDAYITVKYSDGTKQTVWIPLKIKSDLDNNGSNITLSANSKDVHYGQSLSDADARGLLKNNNNPIAAGDVSATDSTKEFKSIQWVDDLGNVLTSGPETSVVGTSGEDDVAAHIKITFQDDTYITKNVTVKVHSGYRNADQHLTITSGDKPSDDDAKAAIYNANDLSNNYNATSFAWAQDADGTAMTSSYVTDGTNNDTKHAWVVITYDDGAGVTKKQIVQVNDLTIHNMANGLTVDHVTGGFNYHAVSSGSPYNSPDPSISSDALKGYFTVKDGTADASSDVSSAAWTAGHTVDWTSTTAQTPQVTLTFTDGSSKSYELPTQLVKATVSDPDYSIYRTDLPNSDAAKGKVSDTSALSAYHPTYGWYSDPAGTTALAATDVAEPTSVGSPKTVYLKVDYHKGSATGTEDGYEIIPISLTIQNNSSNYRASLKTGVTGLTLHVGQPNSDFEGSGFFGTNISNLITITKRDGSVVSPIDGSIISSITWGNNSAGRSTEPNTDPNAPSSQTGQIAIKFADSTDTNPDIITVNVPVTILKATAKSDISTNHGHALTASDEISNLTDLNNSNLNFSAPAADVKWALDDSGTALPNGFWDASTDGSTATDPADHSHQVSDAKGIYLIVHYKKGTGAAATNDGTQAIWVPVKIKSDRDNEAANYSVDTYNEDIHYGQAVDPVGLIKHKNTDGTYSDLTDNDIGHTGDAITSITWVSAPNTSVVSDNASTPDVKDVTGQIQITFSDTSTLTTPLSVTLHVHSGYNNTSHTENVISNIVPDKDDAKAAIANATDLSNNYHAISFAWAQDADGTAMTKAYVKSTTNTTKDAWVKITYKDGSGSSARTVTQVVKVNKLQITSQANHYTPEPTVNGEGQANGVVTHVNGSIDMSNLPIQFKYTDAAGNTQYKSLSEIGATVTWADTSNEPVLTKDSDGAHDYPVIIHYADGSTSSTTSPYKVSVNVIGAKAKASASTNHDHALTASDELNNLDTLENDFHVTSGDVSWTDASGNPIDASTYWHDSTDHDHATNPTTNDRINGSKDAYITVKYGDGTHQTVWIPLKIKSDADNIDPETGIIFAHNDRSVTVHADSHNADPSSHITLIETTTGTPIPHKDDSTGLPANGWTFSGWATRDSSGYHDVTSTGLINDLNDSNLHSDGKKDVNNIYAVITLHDNSKLYTPAMTIHVLGAVGQSVTFNHADAVPDATTATDLNNKTAIKNDTALNNQFGTVTYTWMKKQGSTWVEMTADDFNHREVNEPVIVRVKYGSDTNTQDVKLNLTIHDDSDEIDPTNTTAASNGDYNTHVGAKINGSDNFGNVDLKNAISFRDANNHPLFLDNTGAPTWSFAGFVDSATGTTPIDVNVTDPVLTNGYKDNTNLYAYIKLHDGSYTHVKMNHVKVYGGYEAKTTTGSGASAVTTYPTTAAQDPTTDANKALTSEQAQAAIANSSTLNSLFSANGASALTYTWSTDGSHTDADHQPDVNYNEITDNHKVRTADVIITYGDGTKQAVQVHYNVKSMADRIDPDNTNAASSGNYTTHIGANINGSANFGNVDLKNAISFRDSNNHSMFVNAAGDPTWHFAGFVDSATGTTPTDVDMNTADLTNGVHDLTNLYAYIKLPDGSYTHVKMNHVKVYGGYEAKTTTGSGASAVTTYPTTAAQDPATGANKALTSEQAQDAIANSSTLNGLFSASGATALTYTWSTDPTHTGAGYVPDVSYNETTDNTKVRTAYVIITYGDGTTQSVQVHYNVKSLADRVDPSHTDDYNANHTVYDTHVNSDILDSGSVDLTKNSNFEDGRGIKFEDNLGHDITSSVTDWTFVGWKTKSGNTYNDATASDIDVTDSDLTDGSKNANANDGKIYAELQMSDGSHVYIQMKNIKVYGGYTGSTSASVVPGTDLSTTTSQNAAKGDITNSSTLSTKFSNSSNPVKYQWKKQSGSGASLSYADIPVTDTTLTAGQTSKTLAASDGYGILITYGDGRTQFVKKDIKLATSDGEANNRRLSGTIITVEEGHTLTNGKNNDPTMSDAQRAVRVNSVGSGASASTSLPAGTGFAFVGTVDTRTPGEKAAVVRVTYPDNSATKPDIHDVDVIVKVLSQAEEYNPAGRDLTVNRNANVNRNDSTPESENAVRAKDGISNVSALPNNATYSWAGQNPDVSQAGSVVPAVIKVSYSDGSSDLVDITIHVNGTNPGSMASRFDPQGQDLRVHTGTNLSSITAIHDTDPAASGTKSFIHNATDMPNGTTYSWVTEPDTASVGTKTGVIKVTFVDHSTKSLGVSVTVWNDASISVAPTGKNIHITSGQALNPSDGIANKTDLSHVASSNGYTFTTIPSNINHTNAAVTTPTAVIVHYADGSQSAAVPIFVTVDPVAAPGTTPTDAQRYHARGTTIVRDMDPNASLTVTDAYDALVLDAGGASAVQGYAWVNDDFKNTALHSSGLKAGYVKITFSDNSSATVLAYVDVQSDRDRYANELSGKTTRIALNTPTSDSRLTAQNNVNVPSSVPAGTISGYAWVAAPSTATVGTFPESVRVSFADGSHIDVATTLVVYDNRSDKDRNHDALATNDITKHIGDMIANSDAGNAIVDPSRLVGSPTFSFKPTENTNIVDNSGKVQAPAGDKWGIIDVTYGDGSHDTVAVLVHVKSYASEENPAGNNLTVNPGANVNRTAGTPEGLNAINASDGIANKSSLSHVNSYTWASAPDVTVSDRTVNATVRITYSDGSTTDVPILVTVKGTMHYTMADQYDPQGQNLRVHTGANISDPLHIQDTHRAASDPTSAIANSAEMPSGTTYSWVETPDVSTVGDKSGIIKVTFRDNSTKTVGITVTVWNDASVSAVPEGQDIYKYVGDSINANEGIENTSALHNVSGYSFQGVTVPSTITAAAGTKPETVVVKYADGSTNLVPIQVIVTENTTPAPGTPDHRTDAQRYSAVGKTINKDLGSGALTDSATLPTGSTASDAQNAVTVQTGAPLATTNPLVWTSDNFKNTATNSTGLKSGFVTVTYRDGSQKQVRVYVNVQSAADRLRHAFTGKPETVNQGATIPAPSNGYGVQTSAAVPSGTTYAWQTAPSSAVPGSFPETVVINFGDGSHINVPTTLTVRDSRTDADFNVPTAHDLTVHVGDSLPAAASALDNISSLNHYTNTTWQGSVDTSAVGDKPAVVVVHYADGSHNDLGIIVHVVDDASEYDPEGKDLTTSVGAVPNASDGISNKSSLPSGTTYAWVNSPDVSAAGTTVPGMIKVTYADHSSETVLINIKVNGTITENEKKKDAFSYTPEGKNLTTTVGHEPNAADGISNKWNSAISDHDNDSQHNLPDSAHFSWQIAPDVSTAGNKNAVIKVTYADGSADEVGIIVKVTDDAHPSGHVVAPQGQNIETTVGHEPNAADGIANKSDLSHVSGYHFASPVDVSTAGTKAATVVVGYADGSSQDVPIFVIVRNGSTPTPGVDHEADHYHPVGQTIDKDQSTTEHLNNTDAKNAIANNSSLPTNANYAWTDTSFANNALRTSGLKSGQVTITYHDGSQSVVDVFVKVTSDADRYNPSPRPVVVNPSDPNHPSDPSDPTNPTPGVDPSTVPSGTTTSWPKKPDGTPDVPDTTVPGSHLTNIVVTYPDGSHRTIPTVINVPDNRPDNERFNPSGKPFTIDPAHPSQSGDRTRPRDNADPANPMPGVKSNTVPSGTWTSWPTDASGNPTLPPTTPGDHSVTIVVHYPDGGTATVSTTVHIAATPAPSEPSYVAPAPDEDHDLVFFDPENNDQVVKTLPDEIVGEAETDLPADSLRDLIATNIPDGYVLAPSFRITDMFMPTDTSAMRIPVLRRRLVFVTKQGKKKVVVAAVFGVVHGKQWSIISKKRMMALIKKYMPKGYKLANLYKIERTMITDHRDIEIPVQKKAKRHVRKTAKHAKRHVARRTKRR